MNRLSNSCLWNTYGISALSFSVVRGSIENVSHSSERHTSVVEVLAVRVYWQRSRVFERRVAPGTTQSVSPWRGHIHTLLQCNVRPGDGEFLFTGSEHFGEAWLGCAPRYKDFLSIYQAARAARRNSCDFPLDWGSGTEPDSFYPQAASPLYLHCGIPVMFECGIKVLCASTSREKAAELLVKNTFGEAEQGQTAGASCTEAQGGPAFVSFPSLPSVLGDWEGVGLLLSLCASPRLLFTFCVTVALWTEVGGKTGGPPFIITSFLLGSRLESMGFWSYFYSDLSVLKFQIFLASPIYTVCVIDNKSSDGTSLYFCLFKATVLQRIIFFALF